MEHLFTDEEKGIAKNPENLTVIHKNEVNPLDMLLGNPNWHMIGYCTFTRIKKQFKTEWKNATSLQEKKQIKEEILKLFKKECPGGRFLKKLSKVNGWFEVKDSPFLNRKIGVDMNNFFNNKKDKKKSQLGMKNAASLWNSGHGHSSQLANENDSHHQQQQQVQGQWISGNPSYAHPPGQQWQGYSNPRPPKHHGHPSQLSHSEFSHHQQPQQAHDQDFEGNRSYAHQPGNQLLNHYHHCHSRQVNIKEISENQKHAGKPKATSSDLKHAQVKAKMFDIMEEIDRLRKTNDNLNNVGLLWLIGEDSLLYQVARTWVEQQGDEWTPTKKTAAAAASSSKKPKVRHQGSQRNLSDEITTTSKTAAALSKRLVHQGSTQGRHQTQNISDPKRATNRERSNSECSCGNSAAAASSSKKQKVLHTQGCHHQCTLAEGYSVSSYKEWLDLLATTSLYSDGNSAAAVSQEGNPSYAHPPGHPPTHVFLHPSEEQPHGSFDNDRNFENPPCMKEPNR